MPWGAPKPAPAAPPTPAPTANLSAKKVPWGAAKSPVPDSSPAKSFAPAPKPPAAPPAAAPGPSAKKVPWGSAKPAKPPAPPPEPPPEKIPSTVTQSLWALPKTETSALPPASLERPERDAAADDEPTGEQLVAMLSRMTSRMREPTAAMPAPPGPYKARPISFEATRWDRVKLWIAAHRWATGIAIALLLLGLATADVYRLLALDTRVDRQWAGVETALRQRYALVPAYVECVTAYGDDEHYALALAEKAQAAWRAAHTEPQLAAAAGRMEEAMAVLAKIMIRNDQNFPAKNDAQEAASLRFVRLQRQREQSRAESNDTVLRYNQLVNDFNDKVLDPPGSWVAWAVGVHPRAPLFVTGRK